MYNAIAVLPSLIAGLTVVGALGWSHSSLAKRVDRCERKDAGFGENVKDLHRRMLRVEDKLDKILECVRK